jgi:hypothetical protein
LKFIIENGSVTRLILEAPEPGAPDLIAVRQNPAK